MLVRVTVNCLDRRQVFRRAGEVFDVDPAERTKWMEPVEGAAEKAAPSPSLPDDRPVVDADAIDLTRLTKADLIHVAATRYGLDLSMRMNRVDMAAAIEAARSK